MTPGPHAGTRHDAVEASAGPVLFPAVDQGRLSNLLLLSWVCLAGAVMGADYPAGSSGGIWLVVGSLLLWRVYRGGSYLAWHASVVLAFFGVVVSATVLINGPWEVSMFALHLGTGLPLLTRTVRLHAGA